MSSRRFFHFCNIPHYSLYYLLATIFTVSLAESIQCLRNYDIEVEFGGKLSQNDSRHMLAYVPACSYCTRELSSPDLLGLFDCLHVGTILMASLVAPKDTDVVHFCYQHYQGMCGISPLFRPAISHCLSTGNKWSGGEQSVNRCAQQ